MPLMACLLVLSSCQFNVDVAVKMEVDGTGTVTVVASADKDVVAQVPGAIADLRLDDAKNQGWVVDGPTTTDDGGATITLTHPFRDANELANLLNSIGPPLSNVGIARTTDGKKVTNGIDATLALPNGFESFADSDLITAVGGVPFQAQLDQSGATPANNMAFTLRVHLPGELLSAPTGTDVGDGSIQWVAPLDGQTLAVRASTVQQIGENAWAAPVAAAARIGLFVWIAIAVAFIGFVAFARRQRARRHQRALHRLDERNTGRRRG